MDDTVWSVLRNLESRDATSRWFNQINDRTLNATRAKEINSAARQAREYFSNAESSDFSVRPLLTFYGVSSLARAVTLLFSKYSGESSLTKGHGLTQTKWADDLSGELSSALVKIPDLQVTVCNGLFSDFLRYTQNTVCVHVDSSAVQWRLHYPEVPNGSTFSLKDLISRLPDLQWQFEESLDEQSPITTITSLSYQTNADFFVVLRERNPPNSVSEEYMKLGYNSENTNGISRLDTSTFSDCPIQILHLHKKTFPVPDPYLASPFKDEVRISELGVLYATSYYLGMIARYFPTHWMALLTGDKGDMIWPLLSSAQRHIEVIFPKLVYELILEAKQKPFGITPNVNWIGPQW